MPLAQPNIQSVSDVYDLASAIGKEFEVLIDQHGPDLLSSLMPKVISALENLELLTSQAEATTEELADLRRSIDRMELEKAARLTDQGRFEQEMEQADQEWRRELQRLREENRGLKQALDEVSKGRQVNSSTASDLSSSTPSPLHRQQQHQLLVVARLKAALSAQRDETRALRRELANGRADCEALQAQSDRLAKLNAELMKRLGQCEAADRASSAEDSDSSDCQPERQRGDADSVSSPLSQLTLSPQQPPPRQPQQSASLDPDRPRFTLAELRAVLAERNELKARLLEAEEELAEAYRQGARPASSFEEDPSNSTPLFGFEVISSSSFNNATSSAPSAPLLGGGAGGALSSVPASPTRPLDRRTSGVEGADNKRGSSAGPGASNRSHGSDLGIKYFVLRLICHLRKRLKRQQSWA